MVRLALFMESYCSLTAVKAEKWNIRGGRSKLQMMELALGPFRLVIAVKSRKTNVGIEVKGQNFRWNRSPRRETYMC